ncbi:MAG: hypothetical protein ACOC9O_03250 [Myxococcota bacterium]
MRLRSRDPTRAIPPAWVLLIAAVSAGCPGEIADPALFDAGTGDKGEPLPCDIPDTCGTSACHGGGEPAAELDLRQPGGTARLLDVPSTECDGRLLVDSTDPEASFLLEKLRSDMPECGEPMPATGEPLDEGELACIEQFVLDMVDEDDGADGGGQ